MGEEGRARARTRGGPTLAPPSRAASPEGDRVGNKLRVLLHQVLEPPLLQVLELVVLEVEHDLGPAPEPLARLVARDRERPARLAFPHILLVVVVLGDDGDAVGDEVGGIEADAWGVGWGSGSGLG